jgi:hypothetical protein
MKIEKGKTMKPIRNEKNSVVAYEHQANANRKELRNRSGGLIAWHDKTTDQTFDSHTKRAGFGDQTGKFIPHED